MRNTLNIILYHHLGTEPSELADSLGVSTPPALFVEHLDRLQRDYDIVDLDAVLAGRLPKRPLLITFDDGYRSLLDVAAPLLHERGLPAVFFISGAFVDPGSLPLDNLLCWLSHRVAPGELEQAVTGAPARGLSPRELTGTLARLPYEHRLRLGDELAERFAVDRARLRAESSLFLEASELRQLREFGIEVGNHTRSHVHCRAIREPDAAASELIEHQRELERHCGAPVRSFSYPYGSRHDASPYVERTLAESGHEARFLVESRPNRAARPAGAWHRVSLQQTPASRLYLQLELLPRLRAARDRLRQGPTREATAR